MANDLSAFTPEAWASTIQDTLRKSLVGREIANFGLEANLTEGNTVNRPYISDLSANTYVDASGVTIQDAAPTNEYLTVDTTKEASFYVQQKDIIQNKYSTAKIYTDSSGYALRDAMDSALLEEVANAGLTLDQSDFSAGGSGAITPAVGTIIEQFSLIRKKLHENSVKENGDFFAVVDPTTFSIIEQKAAASGFNVADATLKNGFVGNWMGFDIYISNNSYTTGGDTYLMAGKKGCVDMVVQAEPRVLTTQPSTKIGKNYITWDLYGIKTFHTGGQRMVSVHID